MKQILSRFGNRQIVVFYILDTDTGLVGMTILPASMEESLTLDGEWRVENLVQLKLVGDAYPGGYSQGITMRSSESCDLLRYTSQTVSVENGIRQVKTHLSGPRVSALHTLELPDQRGYARIRTEITNTSGELQKVEMLSSFSLCNLSPIDEKERMQELELIRMESRWSGEGKLLRQTLTDLHMEPSWLRMGVNCVRWGQVGSMPVRGWFPWAALKDHRHNLILGAQLGHPGSWQMELYERDDKVALSGGLADREFGHWMKELTPGETLETPEAVITAACGDADEIGYLMTSAQQDRLNVPESEKDLPFIFNEYCTTWGNPTEENLKKIIATIKGKGFRYLVIDAGWYAIGDGVWYEDQGDWNANAKRFPNSLKAIADEIRAAGMIPGIWFEFECIGRKANAWKMENLQLQRDGIPISDCGKRFWDMRKDSVTDYLDHQVIRLLKENGFGYIKVDYNGNIGIGADGGESQGEVLRESVLASRDYFRHMRAIIPDLVVENCASGGHRLEPAMMEVSSMASFSDAHECISIPVIAAALHRAILPAQSQIWAVMRATDSERRTVYSLTAAMLGRMCLSGDIYDLSTAQWTQIDNAMAYYRACVPVIRHGFTRISGDPQPDWNHLTGDQIVLRQGTEDAEKQLMVTIHRFSGKGELKINLPSADYHITAVLSESDVVVSQDGDQLILQGLEDLSGASVLLTK